MAVLDPQSHAILFSTKIRALLLLTYRAVLSDVKVDGSEFRLCEVEYHQFGLDLLIHSGKEFDRFNGLDGANYSCGGSEDATSITGGER